MPGERLFGTRKTGDVAEKAHVHHRLSAAGNGGCQTVAKLPSSTAMIVYMRTNWRYLAAGLCALALISTSIFSVDGKHLLDNTQAIQGVVVEWIEAHPVAGGISYVLFAACGMVTPLPSAVFVMLVGGFLFGPVGGGLLVAIGASLAATAVYLSGRALFAELVERLLANRLRKVQHAVAANPFPCLLALRLVPGMPAWLSNLAPVPLTIPARTILGATFIGILPMCLIVAAVGDSLATFTALADQLSAGLWLRPSMLAPLLGMFALAILSLASRRRLRKAPS
jgi:uncharacterized membrane protein YdjX (TVP38/TMEM64 family)